MLMEYIKRFSKNSIIYGIGNMLSKMLALLILPFLTEHIKPVEYGIISMFTVFSTFVQPVFQLGLSAGITPIYFEQETKRQKNNVILLSFWILLVSALLMIGGCFVFRSFLLKVVIGVNGYEDLFFVYMLSVAIASIELPFLYKYQFEEKSMQFVITTFFSSIACYGLLFFLVIYCDFGIEGYIYGLLLGEVIRFFGYFLGLKVSLIDLDYDKILIKKIFVTSFPFIPSFFSLYVLQQIERIFLKDQYGLDVAGVYSVGTNIGSAINIVIGGIVTAWTPFFLSFKQKSKEDADTLGKITTLYIIVIGTITLCFFSFSKPVVITFVNQAYFESYFVIGMYASSLFFHGLFSFFLPPIYYAGETRFISLLQIPAAILSVFISRGLIGWLGIRGAGLSIATSFFILAIITECWNLGHRYYFRINYQWRQIYVFGIFYLFMIVAIIYLQKKDYLLWVEWLRAFLITLLFCLGVLFYLVKVLRAYKWIQKRGIVNEKDEKKQESKTGNW